MIDYLVGISQNLVAEILIVGFTLGVWQLLKRRWKTVRPMALAQVGAAIERHLTRGLAILLFLVSLFVTRIDDALGGVGAALLALMGVSAGAAYLGGLLHIAFRAPWLTAMRIGYWLAFLAAAVAWATDPHVLLEETVHVESAQAFGLVAASVALLGVQAVPLWLVPDLQKTKEPLPWRGLFLVSVAGTAVGAILLRDTFTWQQALASGPTTGLLITLGIAAAFSAVLLGAQALTEWADRRGWISYRHSTGEEPRRLGDRHRGEVTLADDEILKEVPADYLPRPAEKSGGGPAGQMPCAASTVSLNEKAAPTPANPI
jgi:hypothetical protein